MRKTGRKWKTAKCGRCYKPHSGYSGKLDADDVEYVVCGSTNKRMNVRALPGELRDLIFATEWELEVMAAISDGPPVKVSRFISLVLRHKPEAIGVTLDEEGWIGVDELLKALGRNGRSVTREELLDLVDQDDKRRFVIRDGRIRANQGHSIDVQLGLEPVQPPDRLYHGTTERFMDSIRSKGLMKMKRQHVHLSSDDETARRVGARYGRPVILRISAAAMHAAEHVFFLSENDVWLTDAVPYEYLEEIDRR